MGRLKGRKHKCKKGYDDPERALMAMVLRRAVMDLKLSDESLRHEARSFLLGEWAGALMDCVGIDQREALSALGL